MEAFISEEIKQMYINLASNSSIELKVGAFERILLTLPKFLKEIVE
jgi:hypothetical protein